MCRVIRSISTKIHWKVPDPRQIVQIVLWTWRRRASRHTKHEITFMEATKETFPNKHLVQNNPKREAHAHHTALEK